MTTYTWDPTSVVISIGAIRVSGFMDGVFITAERDVDAYEKMIGAAGDVTRYRSGNRGGSVRITLQQSSATNDLLYQLARADELAGTGVATLQVLDLNGTTIVHATNVWVKKLASVEYSEKLAGRSWVFDCDSLDFIAGQSNSSATTDTTHAYVQLDGFEIDGVMSEGHDFDAEITDHPVEVGTDVADNIRNKPSVVSLTDCVVTDTPIGDIATRRGVSTKPSNDALAKLDSIRTNREAITIITALRTYQNMALQQFSVTKTSKETGALRFRCTFKQIEFITNARTTIRVSTPSAAAKKDLGAKPNTPVDATNGKPESNLLQIGQAGAGYASKIGDFVSGLGQ